MEQGNSKGVTTPPLRVCRPQNVCGVCFNFWQQNRIVVPEDLPPDNGYCPVPVGLAGLGLPCLKVDDLMDIEVVEPQLDLKLVQIENYPVSMARGRPSIRSSFRPSGTWDVK